MKKPFSKASYLAQVRRLRQMAETALMMYPIQVRSIHFINHGENTTFRVLAKNGQSYLLRIHRNNYHTKSAITEEMDWLSHLSKKGLSVPQPVLSKRKHFVQTVTHPDIDGPRNCSVFKWIHGGFIRKSLLPKHMFEVGQIIADLQNNTPKGKTKNRQYWTAVGLAGPDPKFGSIDKLAGISSKQQKVLTKARKSLFTKLKQFEKEFPSRQGLIHADLHFGNIVSMGEKLGAIDFDDCGYGFHAYDLVIPYISAQYTLGKERKKLLPEYKKALIDGYKTKRKWDENDEKIFLQLVTARKLLMLGWLNSRSDNPKLRKFLKGAAERALSHLKEQS